VRCLAVVVTAVGVVMEVAVTAAVGHGGFRGPGSFHADRFGRRFFGGGLGLGVLGSALLIAPPVYYAPPPIYYTPLPTPCALPYPPNNYPPQGYNPPEAWLEQPCQ
jgi:hypothetical protein